MLSVVTTFGATVANKALVLSVASAGLLTDLQSASFRILDAAGAQVYPAGSNPQALDLVTSRVGLGRYAASWTPGAATVGQYVVRWAFVRSIGAAEETFDDGFELVAVPYSGPYYTTVADLRSEGLTTQMAADAKAQRLIVIASRYVEMFTGRFFYSRYKTVDVDGSGGRAVQMAEPVIAVERVAMNFVSDFTQQDLVIPNDTLRIYNRHLSQELTEPDDRDNPKLEFVHGQDLGGTNYDGADSTGYVLRQLLFPYGRQNVRVTGLFGYTEFNGSTTGQTPDMIRECTKLLVFRNLGAMVTNARRDRQLSGRILTEATRDQNYTAALDWRKGAFTSDPEIDQILATFSRPPYFGAV